MQQGNRELFIELLLLKRDYDPLRGMPVLHRYSCSWLYATVVCVKSGVSMLVVPFQSKNKILLNDLLPAHKKSAFYFR